MIVLRWSSACQSLCLSYFRPSVRSFQDDNLSKYQCTFTKLDVCIGFVESWFGIANGQISSIFDGVVCSQHDNSGALLFDDFYFSEKTGFDISCKLPGDNLHNLHEMSKPVFSENKKNISICLLLKILTRVLLKH